MPAAADMDIIEEFFKVRAAPVMHEVCPLANKELLPLLSERGYRPLELSNVMFMQLANPPDMSRVSDSNLRVRIMDAHESETWAQTAAAGWSEFAGIADLMLDLMRVSAAREDGACFLVEADGQPIATGGLALHDGVALFAGASTIPEWRRRGAQQLLFQSRYQYAIDAGCDIAMVSTEPGSASQRNAERQGFRVAYTRTKWHLPNLSSKP
jgi:GNAT superfamily N-acetyltransferase